LTTLENEIKATLLDLLVAHSEHDKPTTELVEEYTKKILPLAHMVNAENYQRYYITGVSDEGVETFLTTAIDQKKALEDAGEYLSGHWKFDKIVITTLDGKYREVVERGNN
jgi:hypothetical protein